MKTSAEVSKGTCNYCFAPNWACPPELLQSAEANSTFSTALSDLCWKICPAHVIANLPVEIMGDLLKETIEAAWR